MHPDRPFQQSLSATESRIQPRAEWYLTQRPSPRPLRAHGAASTSKLLYDGEREAHIAADVADVADAAGAAEVAGGGAAAKIFYGDWQQVGRIWVTCGSVNSASIGNNEYCLDASF